MEEATPSSLMLQEDLADNVHLLSGAEEESWAKVNEQVFSSAVLKLK